MKKEETKTPKHAKKEVTELETLRTDAKALKKEVEQLKEENKLLKEENHFYKNVYVPNRFMCEYIAEDEGFITNGDLLARTYGTYKEELIQLKNEYGYEKLNNYFLEISKQLQEAKKEEK